ncbi:SH3 domain-containing protein C23A1.17-like [Amphibalanus amphitrite]|uniref:SH3 domain-containing protein C23A1.17-like n=1 Tax=Amphibalanus amphitrite TaxID=1232801 RepID=UPI001C909297|nr:SH3 domain-containing protein C23A1.17-like [Amphibalanus amphitrite]XP_043237877.1 SH3 domain-containing protein C23A1.17-like [Amphibalanus amphitrite]
MSGMREVYRAGWLKKITSDDKKKSFKNPRVEKVWMVFCVHDEQTPFLEQYGSRQAAAGHQPEFGYPLAECYHVSASIRPTLASEHEFVITLRQDVVKFSSSRSEVINDWISILRNQLHELKVLESKSNLYSKAPRLPMQFGLQRDPNSPLPAPPQPPVLSAPLLGSSATPRPRLAAAPAPSTSSAADVTVTSSVGTSRAENTYSVSPSASAAGTAPTVPTSCGGAAPEPSVPAAPRRVAPTVPVTVRAAPVTPPASPPAHWTRFDDEPSSPLPSPPPLPGVPSSAAPLTPPTPPAAGGRVAADEHVTVISVGEALRLTVPDSAGGGEASPPRQRRMTAPARPAVVPPPAGQSVPDRRVDRPPLAASPPAQPAAEDTLLYERLSEASSAAAASRGVPSVSAAAAVVTTAAESARTSTVSPAVDSSRSHPALPPTPPAAAAGATVAAVGAGEAARGHSTVQRSHSSVPQQRPSMRPPLQRQTSDTSLDSRGATAGRPRPAADPARRDGAARQLSLREHQVMVLRREIAHRPGVRMMLPRRTVSGALALVDGFGAVWLAGWRWKEQPALACALHVGDRIASVAGVAVTSAAEFGRLVKQQQAPVVELVVQRMPHAIVVAMKREHEGQPLGLVRDGATGELLQVLPDGLAASHGLPARSGSADGLSLCNWYITEVNSRAVSLFSKGDELGSRLAAVGRDISLVVQPADLVKLLKRQLKAIRGYKQYVVQ